MFLIFNEIYLCVLKLLLLKHFYNMTNPYSFILTKIKYTSNNDVHSYVYNAFFLYPIYNIKRITF